MKRKLLVLVLVLAMLVSLPVLAATDSNDASVSVLEKIFDFLLAIPMKILDIIASIVNAAFYWSPWPWYYYD